MSSRRTESETAISVNKARREYFAIDGSWERYPRHIRGRIEGEGATLVDAIDWFADDGSSFVDNLHLTKPGAAEFSRRLAPIVAVEAGAGP